MPLTEKQYSVYKHTNKTNGKVYIGITGQKPERRWQKGAGYTGTYFGNAINKYGWDSFEHEVLCWGLTEEEAKTMEIALIAQYRSDDRNYGYNISEGGDIPSNPVTRRGADHFNAKAVNRISKDGEVVRFETLNEAAEAMGINYRGISKACHGISQTYKGYVWEYADIDFKKEKHNKPGKYAHKHQWKQVTLIEPSGFIRTFDNIEEAGKETGIGRNNISRYAHGLRKDASGRRWLVYAFDK